MKPFDYQARKHTINKIDILKRQESKSDNDFKNEYLDINSINLDLNETIYRIFNYDFFIQDLIAKKLTLINPSKWDDPFENFLFSSTGVLDDGREVSFENISNSYFALCWSLREESDGLWRNYKGKNDFAIKLKTTSRKLFNAIYDINDKFHYLNYFIGKVDYVTDEEIIKFFNDKIDFLGASSGIEFINTLLTKRKAFDYEEEIRVIIHSQEKSNSFLKIETEYNNWVDEIIFDPWVDNKTFETEKQKIIDAGFIGKISKSNLYNRINFRAKL